MPTKNSNELPWGWSESSALISHNDYLDLHEEGEPLNFEAWVRKHQALERATKTDGFYASAMARQLSEELHI